MQSTSTRGGRPQNQDSLTRMNKGVELKGKTGEEENGVQKHEKSLEDERQIY